MKRLRPAIHALLGLLLLVQGVAVAAANLAVPHESAAATESAMPCHGDQAGGDQHCPCCGHDCPDMTACALGAMAVESALSFAFSVAQDVLDSAASPSPVSLAPPSPLRPPISPHV